VKQYLAHAAEPTASAPMLGGPPMGLPFPYGLPELPMPLPGFDPNLGMFPGMMPPGMIPPGMVPGFDPSVLAAGMWGGDGTW
jgi:hypothetical protein